MPPEQENEERKTRILDAASELFVHYGYDKTTVSDIARAAGVSKGAIYLHFESKDALFEGLLVRETMKYQVRWLELLDADPQGGTIGGMYKNILFALSASPFMSAVFRQDRRLIGNYIHKPDNVFARQDQGTRFHFVKMMQDAGALRQDADPLVVSHIMNMLAYGLVAIDELIDSRYIPPLEDTINGIADLLDRAYTPADGGNSEAGKQVVRQISDAAQAAFEQSRK